ncbi:MAG: glycosyltransferase, partial [Pseudomonadota bacterium]
MGPEATAMEKPCVTAILPAYKAEAFLSDTLDSLAAQTWPNLEIVAADDGSDDATGEMLEAFAKTHPKMKVVRRDQNIGWIRNTNDLMSRASGDFMFFAFHDDVIQPGYVTRLTQALLSEPRAVLAYSDLEQVDTDGSRKILRTNGDTVDVATYDRLLDHALQKENWHIPHRGVFRASAYRALGGMRAHERGEYAADWIWLLGLLGHGGFLRVPEVLCTKRYMKQSLTKVWQASPEINVSLIEAGKETVAAMRTIGPIHKMMLLSAMSQRQKGGDGRLFVERSRKAVLRLLG